MEEAGFNYGVYLFIEFEGGVNKHPKIFCMGFNCGGEVAQVVVDLCHGVGGAK